jgi:chromate transporter
VIANLALYFAINTLFSRTTTIKAGPLAIHLPDPATLRPVHLGIAVIAALLIFAAKWSVLRTLGVCAVLGLVAGLLGLPGR